MNEPIAKRLRCGYSTDAGLGIGGDLKATPEDFEVEEIAAYEPGGSGEHLFLWIEKRDLAADAMLSRLSRNLGCSRNDIGQAGLKDRRAVTRQWISVPGRCESNLAQVGGDDLRILRAVRHRNKLRTGHARGNRFRIRLRNVAPDAAATARSLIEQIADRGIPNFYGDQRFGTDDQTLALGVELLDGRRRPETIPVARRRFLLRLALSAVQSALFNNVVSARLADGLLRAVLVGDIMQVVSSGGLFEVLDQIGEQARFDARDTVVTGPMFGPEMKRPAGEPDRREERVLKNWGLSREVFGNFRNLTPGARRPMLVWPAEFVMESDGTDMVLQFALPSGCYATSVVREFQKTEFSTGTART